MIKTDSILDTAAFLKKFASLDLMNLLKLILIAVCIAVLLKIGKRLAKITALVVVGLVLLTYLK